MKNNNKRNISSLILSFFTCVILTAAAITAFKYYIPFSNETAGTYAVATILGDSLKVFLIKLLLLVSGLLAFITFLMKSVKGYQNKILFNKFIIAFGVIWVILPFISVYVISRFTGTLIIQTVSGIAVIANVVFMMLSVCFAIISAIDLIHSIFMISQKEKKADCLAMVLSGIPTGAALVLFVIPIIESAYGINYVFLLIGILSIVIGILNSVFKPCSD